MNIINPIATSSQALPQNTRARVEVLPASDNAPDPTQVRTNTSLRVIRVAEEGVEIAEFGGNGASGGGTGLVNASPLQQYESNQQLLQREQIASQVGIDLFA
ncbi:hypothetical protein [Aliikangiella coralliicola]|uniref:Uncharacterized protein n=1 Tax=Aliikangiella coralliicola TaxID=2592383 RepID=A0A545U8I7_9GAMM|nr:hypothetical protein [Aliikangiella coralliicola]TQV85787.1 hypothetical protein FLL46_17840 [Aliikangiella coralliicola]